MAYILYDYVSAARNEFRAWTTRLEKPQRAKLNAKLDMLAQLGMDLLPQVLTGTDTPGIMKMRVKGQVQLRPMLCRGPIDDHQEFTLLLGAREVGGKLDPAGADATAGNYRGEVLANPQQRREKHERIS